MGDRDVWGMNQCLCCGEVIFEEYVFWEESFFCMECLENMSTRSLLDFFQVEVLWKNS